ncbi:MAG: class I SAM-dependent methyltransferase, partial [Patescibacteria group bacterium]
MENNFVDQEVVAINTKLHENRHRAGPSENVVRLVKWFFKEPGYVLDYGCGDGSNMEFLLNEGYTVDGIDITDNAIARVQKRLEGRSGWSARVLRPKDEALPYEDSQFDYILCNQVIYYIANEERITHLLNEFKRVLKPKGKLIITALSRFSDACTKGRRVEGNVYEWDMPIGEKIKSYIFRDENHVRKVMNMFEIAEIGFFDNCYCGVRGHHWV